MNHDPFIFHMILLGGWSRAGYPLAMAVYFIDVRAGVWIPASSLSNAFFFFCISKHAAFFISTHFIACL